MQFTYCDLSLYNRQEHLQKLGMDAGVSDESLLLELYRIWGEKLFDVVNGDFAFSIYDKSKNELFSARDFLGIKALYYVVEDDNYYFSNDIDTLFELSGIEKKVNLRAMETLLYQQAVDYEETMYEQIKRIPPGHYLKVVQGEAQLIRYWYPENIKIDYDISIKDAAQKFHFLFEKAIVSRMGSDAETAYELSGGLDSSSIVSLLSTTYPEKKIDTYSMYFDELKCDEVTYIQSVEKKFDFHSVGINSNNIDYNNKFNFDFNYRMSPHWPITLTFSMYFPMIKKMREDDKKIIITGQGGDHLLSGHCYGELEFLKRLSFKEKLNELKYLWYVPGCSFRNLLSFFLKKKQKDSIQNIVSLFRKEKSIDTHKKTTDLFSLRNIESMSKRLDISFLLSASQVTVMDGNIFHVLEKVYDMELRHPFFDKELVEFVLSLPPEFKYSKGWTKVLLRYAMQDILPEEIRSRNDKAEFSEILVQQLQSIDIRHIIDESKFVSLGIIEQKEIDKQIMAFENNDYKEIMFLWRIMNIAYWYKSMKLDKEDRLSNYDIIYEKEQS